MHKQNRRLSYPRGPGSRWVRSKTSPISINALRTSMLFLLVCVLCLCQAGYAQPPPTINYSSGQQHAFSNALTTPCNDNFFYLWSASAGTNTGDDKCNFIWTAPMVSIPTEVTISLLVSNKDRLSCNSRDEIKITVNPLPVVSLNPAVVVVCSGEDAVLTADTTGTVCPGQLTYRWYKDNVLIVDATSSSYTVSEPGKYTVEVTCSKTGCINSATATSISIPLPVVSLNVPVFTGTDVVLTADTTGTLGASQFSYKWYKDGVLIQGATSSSYTVSQPGKYTVEVTCSNNCGSASASATVIIKDGVPPTITCPADKEVCNDAGQTYASIPLADLGQPTAKDPQGAVTITNNAPENNQYPIGTTTINWTATDTAGNKASCDQKVTVKDCEKPTISCPADKQVCNDAGRTYATIPLADLGQPTVKDPQGAVTVANNAPENSQYSMGITIVTWTATDIAGNKASCDQKITVKECKPIKNPLTIKKTTLNTSVHRGEDIIYNITVCNEGPYDLQNVTVWDILPAEVELVSVYPEPASSSSLTWFIPTLESGQCFPAQIVVRVPIVDINYDMSQDVQGEGFVNVHNDYDTHQGPDSLTNCAYAKADLTETVSSCVTTGIIDPGTELKRREFGSGTYASEEVTRVRTENKSIKTVTSLSAVHRPTTFSLPQGRSIGYATKWTEKSKGINSITGATMNEEYTSAAKINKERSIELDRNGSTMTTEVEFAGQGHIGVLKKQSPEARPKTKTFFESREDYAGSFKINERVDEYGSSVVSNKSASGFGYVVVEKRIRDSQRTYESGTGSYQSEELIDTPTSYMAKNISLFHAPANYSYSPSFIADQDMLWSEGMWSKSGGLSGGNLITDIGPSRKLAATSCLANGTSSGTLISEKYSYLDNLQKETVASGLNEMKSQASFRGTADYRVLSHGENGTSVVDNEERYVGNYDINRHILLTGASKYDMPHLTVIKEGRIKNEWYNKVNATQAEYTITITNDGNRALAPIYVRDLFPAGTQYVRSTMRPASLDANEANWTLVHLGIGNAITIGLTLNVTEGSSGNNLVNRVVACGVLGDKSVCAGNYSSLEFGWQTCCPPEVLVSKKAWLDESDPTEVHYRIVVKNNAPDSVAVTVTDQLPGGMTLLGASINPNTDNTGQMVWAMPQIEPGRIETIDYTARALRDGGYTSTVHIDATAINGTGYDTMDASAYIEITRTGVASRTFRYDGWEPPAWNLSSPEGESFADIRDGFILEVESDGL